MMMMMMMMMCLSEKVKPEQHTPTDLNYFKKGTDIYNMHFIRLKRTYIDI